MTTAVPTRFNRQQLEVIDRLVAEGVGGNRSEVIRRAVDHLAESLERSQVGCLIAESYRAMPQTADDNIQAMANACAMTEAEPW